MNKSAAKTCECDKCGHVAVTIPDTKHRRCPGGKNEDGLRPLRDKENRLENKERGTWN